MKISIPEKSKEVSDSDIVEEQAKFFNKWSKEEAITGCFWILVMLNMIILFILGPMIALPPTSFDHSGVREILAQISSLKDDFSSIKEDVKYLMGAMKSIQGRTADLEDGVESLNNNVEGLDECMNSFNGTMKSIKGRTADLEDGMESLDARVSDLEHRT